MASPPYLPSNDSPSYSAVPRRDERIVDSAPATNPGAVPPGGIFSCVVRDGVTLVLHGQKENISSPVYDGLRPITGILLLETGIKISKIDIKLYGKHIRCLKGKTDAAEISVILDKACQVWGHSDGPTSSTRPSSIPFSIELPQYFQDSDSKRRRLPPSHHVQLASGTNSLSSECRYNLQVMVTSPRKLLGGHTTTCKVPFEFIQRERPNLPVMDPPIFFQTIKSSPDEWHQQTAIIKPTNKNLKPIYCLLFLPSVLVFGLRDVIPYHLQLIGPTVSIMQFLGISNSNTAGRRRIETRIQEPTILVNICRDVVVRFHPAVAQHSMVVGHGTVVGIPPSMHLSSHEQTVDQEIDLNWQGEIKTNSDISFGQFFTAGTTMTDRIVAQITPAQPDICPFSQTRLTVPIHLVTDSWDDRS